MYLHVGGAVPCMFVTMCGVLYMCILRLCEQCVETAHRVAMGEGALVHYLVVLVSRLWQAGGRSYKAQQEQQQHAVRPCRT
jgi:hypothetical protein